jgi:hypothetical protein
MSWLIVVLKAIPALRKIGELLERNIKQANARVRRNEKRDLVDDAIADALANKRVRKRKVRERQRPDKSSS